MSIKIFLSAVFFQSVILLSTINGQDDLIAQSRDCLYSNREKSIRIMEDAVKANPDRIDYRVELIQYLDSDGADFFANVTSLIAMKDHPESGLLLESRIALVNEEAADILPVLQQIKGFERRARDIQHLLSHEIPIRYRMKQNHYSRLVARLIDANLWKEAEAVLDRGLEKFPSYKPLLVQRAITLAKRGNLKGSIALQKQFRLTQPNLPSWALEPWLNWGLADRFLQMEEPEFSIASFEFDEVEELDERFRLILYASLKLTGKSDAAAGVLDSCDSAFAKLVEIGIQVQMEDEAAANAVLAAWIESMAEANSENESDGEINRGSIQGSFGAVDRQPARWPPSLMPFISTGRKHIEEYFEKHEDESGHFESIKKSTRVSDVQPRPLVESLTLDSKVERFKGKLEAGTERENWFIRRELSYTLATHSRFDEAADTLVENALGWRPSEYTLGLRIRQAAVHWSIYKRKAQSITYFLQHPEKLAPLRKILGNPYSNTDPFRHQDMEGFGSEVLGFVFNSLKPSTISAKDRSELVKVVEQIGSEQDIPVMIEILGLIVQYTREDKDRTGFELEQYQNDRNSEKAIHVALEKLTGSKNNESDRVARVEFWRSWWNENAERIMTGN